MCECVSLSVRRLPRRQQSEPPHHPSTHLLEEARRAEELARGGVVVKVADGDAQEVGHGQLLLQDQRLFWWQLRCVGGGSAPTFHLRPLARARARPRPLALFIAFIPPPPTPQKRKRHTTTAQNAKAHAMMPRWHLEIDRSHQSINQSITLTTRLGDEEPGEEVRRKVEEAHHVHVLFVTGLLVGLATDRNEMKTLRFGHLCTGGLGVWVEWMETRGGKGSDAMRFYQAVVRMPDALAARQRRNSV